MNIHIWAFAHPFLSVWDQTKYSNIDNMLQFVPNREMLVFLSKTLLPFSFLWFHMAKLITWITWSSKFGQSHSNSWIIRVDCDICKIRTPKLQRMKNLLEVLVAILDWIIHSKWFLFNDSYFMDCQVLPSSLDIRDKWISF